MSTESIKIEFLEIKKMTRIMTFFFALLGFTGLTMYFIIPDLTFLIPGVFFLTLMIYSLGHKEGIHIDTENSQIREYKSNWGFSTGKWRELNRFTNLVILIKQAKHNKRYMYSLMHSSNLILRGQVYELYLMDDKHFRRQFVSASQNKELIYKMAQDLEKKLSMKLTKYNPATKRIRKN